VSRRINVIGYCATAAVAVAGVAVGLVLGSGSGSPEAASHHIRGTAAETSVQAPGSIPGPASSPMQAAHCGALCVSLSSSRLGADLTLNVAMTDNNGQGGKAGRKLNVRTGADVLPDGDFSLSFDGRVSQFCGTDAHDYFAPTTYVCANDSGFAAFEVQWTPFGQSTGLCAGVAVANKAAENVTLRPCGASDHTLWIADAAHGTGHGCRSAGNNCPWMNASDSSFRKPFVLTLNGATTAPADQLRLAPMNLKATGAQVRAFTNQLFTFVPNKDGQ
jgi:hypothetical protein